MYIPRKFWNDEVYTMNTMNEQENIIYSKLSVKNLETEIEIFADCLG